MQNCNLPVVHNLQSMLKAMSVMVDNFDTQMVDYMADIDMQVQGFSSDSWLHDEVRMEEDAPSLKTENFAQEGDLTIEIDMEDHNSAEYDMVDDEQLHPPEILDVEVYDASLAHSPAMGVFDSALPAESTISPVVIPPTEPQETDVTTLPDPPITAESIATSVAPPAAPLSEEIDAPPVSDLPRAASHTGETNTVSIHQSLAHDAAEPLEYASTADSAPPIHPEYPPSDAAGAESVEGRSQDEVSPLPDLQSHVVDDLNSAVVAPDEGLPPESLETPHTGGLHVESTSGDPLEISEGVYIDPPPAVLLTISSDDHEHEFCLFNEPAEWLLPSGEHNSDAHRTLLHHLPTMYYESLFSLFEALRQDEFIQSTFQLLEVELVLQAVDLALTISEDNVYSRDVSLHDLNILHDGSGIGGPLKTKLYALTPRFIIQYQQLQEHVSQLQLGNQSRGVPFGGHTETHENQQLDLDHTPGHQGIPTGEGEPETGSLANREESKRSEESAETETHLQLFQPELVADLYQEEEHEDENRVSQFAETGEDQGTRGDEEDLPTDGYPTVEDNDCNSVSGHTEGENAVISLDVLEAAVVDPQLAEYEQADETSAPLHDGTEEDDETEPENEPELDDNHDTRQAGSSELADGHEVDKELEEEADAQGDEYDAESEPLPDQFQARPQDVHRHLEPEANTTKIDHKTLSNDGDGREYNEEEPLPELPTDPISFEDQNWGQEEFEDANESWNGGDEKENSVSNHSSVTLSSRGSKRNYDEYESGGEGYDEEEDQQWELPDSPDPKRTRTQ